MSLYTELRCDYCQNPIADAAPYFHLYGELEFKSDETGKCFNLRKDTDYCDLKCLTKSINRGIKEFHRPKAKQETPITSKSSP